MTAGAEHHGREIYQADTALNVAGILEVRSWWLIILLDFPFFSSLIHPVTNVDQHRLKAVMYLTPDGRGEAKLIFHVGVVQQPVSHPQESVYFGAGVIHRVESIVRLPCILPTARFL